MSDHRDSIDPPATMTVFHDHRPVLYGPDGKAYVRQAGFTAGGVMRNVQTRGTNPALSDNTNGVR